MNWPTSQDYNEAIQNAASSFADPGLKSGAVTLNSLGLPVPRSGNFADVYQFNGGDDKMWAVKCFTRKVDGLQQRYAKIDEHLTKAKLPFTVGFKFFQQGIRVRGQWFPLLKMEWVEGFTLNEFVRDNASKPQYLHALVQMWGKLTARLRDADFAHADLQHGNVLLVPGGAPNKLGLKLIDYDGMWVPALAETHSGEIGHPNFQHPLRLKNRLYNADVDRFPHLVVACALRAVMIGGRALWDKFDNGDNLLFKEPDLRDPARAKVFTELWNFRDDVLCTLVGTIALASREPLRKTPWLDDLLLMDGGPRLTSDDEKKVIEMLGVAPHFTASKAAAAVHAPMQEEFGDFNFDDDLTDEKPAARPQPARTNRKPMREEKKAPMKSRMPYYIGGAVLAACLIGGIIAVIAGGGKKNGSTPQGVEPQVVQRNVDDDKKGRNDDKTKQSAAADKKDPGKVRNSDTTPLAGKDADVAKNRPPLEKSDEGVARVDDDFLKPDNWEGMEGLWTINGTTIVGKTEIPFDNSTFFRSKKKYKDFELSCQARITDGAASSGIQVRSAAVVNSDKYRVFGPQADMGNGRWGHLVAYRLSEDGKSHSNFTFTMAAARPGAGNANPADFNDYQVRVVGKRMTITVNGVITVDQEFSIMPDEGIIAFELDKGRAMEVTFKNIVFKQLNAIDDSKQKPDIAVAKKGPGVDQLGAGFKRLWALPPRRVGEGRADKNCLSFTNDGSQIISAFESNAVRFNSVKDGAYLGEQEASTNRILTFQAIPDDILVIGDDSRTIRFWDRKAKKQLLTIDDVPVATRFAVATQRKEILIPQPNGEIRAYSTVDGKFVNTIHTPLKSMTSIVCSPDGATILIASADGVIYGRSAETQEFKNVFAVGNLGDSGVQLLLSPDTKYYAIRCKDHFAVLPLGSGKPTVNFSAKTIAYAVAFTSDSRYLVSLSPLAINYWDVETGEQIGSDAPGGSALALSPDGTLAAVSDRGPMRLYRLPNVDGKNVAKKDRIDEQPKVEFKQLWKVDGGANSNCLAFTSDSSQIVSADQEAVIRFNGVADGGVKGALETDKAGIDNVRVLPNDVLVVSAERSIAFWDQKTKKKLFTTDCDENSPRFAVASRRKETLVALPSGEIKVYSAVNGKFIKTIATPLKKLTSVDCSADGKTILIASADGSVYGRFSETDDFKSVFTVHNPVDADIQILLAPDSKYCAVRVHGHFSVVQLVTRKMTINSTPRTAAAIAAFTSDSRYLVGLTPAVMRCWDVETGEQIGSDAPGGSALALSPDSTVAAVADRGSTRLYRLPNVDDESAKQTGFKQQWKVEGSANNNCLGFTSDGSEIFSAKQDAAVRFNNVKGGGALDALETDKNGIVSVQALPNDIVVLVAERQITFWDRKASKKLFTIDCGEMSPVFAVAASRKEVLVARPNGEIKVYSAVNGKSTNSIATPLKLEITNLACSAGRGTIAVAHANGAVFARTSETGAFKNVLKANTDQRPQKDRPKAEKFIGQWKILRNGTEAEFSVTLNKSFEAQRSGGVPRATGKWEVAGNEVHIIWSDGWRDILRPEKDGFVKLGFRPGTSWDDRPYNSQPAVKDGIDAAAQGADSTELALSPDAKYIAIHRGDLLSVLELATDKTKLKHTNSAPFTGVTFTSDSRRLVSLAGEAIHYWDVETGKQIGLAGPGGNALALSPDSTFAAVADTTGSLRLYRLPNGEPAVVTIVAPPKVETTSHKPGEVVEVLIAKGVKMKFCWVPPGEAQLGSPKAERQEALKALRAARAPKENETWLSSEAEESRGKFKTKGFWLGKFAVMQEEWDALMGSNPSYFAKGGAGKDKVTGMNTSRFPVEQVSWDDCQEFVKKLSGTAKVPGSFGKGKFALPHDDEWEYACRGGKGNKQPFYFGDELNGTQANCKGDFPFGTTTKGPSLERTAEVGSYEKVAPHPWGLCDMSGNVFQWCDNLQKPTAHVMRGGYCLGGSWDCRSASRYFPPPGYRVHYLGCRIAFLPD